MKKKLIRFVEKDFSLKKSIEIMRNLNRYYSKKPINKLIAFLKNVLSKKECITYFSYNLGVPHQKKSGPGGYPQKIISFLLLQISYFLKKNPLYLFEKMDCGKGTRQKKPIIRAHSNINFLNKDKIWINLFFIPEIHVKDK